MTTQWGLLGPVFTLECRTAARRQTLYAVRALAVAVPFAALTMAWAVRPEPLGREAATRNLKEYAEFGAQFCQAVIGAQLALLMLAAPGAAAGSVCLDKQRGNLLHLLTTDLSAAEIVLGKLGACLLPVLGLMFASVPVLFATTWLGGVDPEALASSFAVLVGTAVLGCALAFLLSVWLHKPHEVLLVVYLLEAAALLADPAWNLVGSLTVRKGPPAWVGDLNPFVMAFAPFSSGSALMAADCGRFLAVTLGLAAACTLLAVVSLRPVVLRQAQGVVRAAGPSVMGRSRRILDRDPLLWYELHRKRPTRVARLIAAAGRVLGLSAAAFAVILIVARHYDRRWSMWVRLVDPLGHWGLAELMTGTIFAGGLLLAGASASAALADERARGNLGVLLTTPIPTWRIVAAKWRAAFRPVLWLMVLLAVIVAIAMLLPPEIRLGQPSTDSRTVSVGLLAGFMLATGAAVISLGLALAVWVRTPGRAVTIGVCTSVALNIVVPLLTLGLLEANQPGWFAPLTGPLGGVTELSQMLGWGWTFQPQQAFALRCILAYATAALALFLLTLASFDRMGRASGRRRPALVAAPADVPAAVPVS